MLRQLLGRDDMKHIAIQALLMLVFVAGALACIGNPNGVSLSFPPQSVNMSKAQEFCSAAPACTQRNESILYATDEGLAVTVDAEKVNIEIPVDKNNTPTFNYTNWSGAYRKELTKLSEALVLNLTSEEIDQITNSSQLNAGAVVAYDPKYLSGMSASFELLTANVIEADQKATPEYCSGPVVKASELPSAPSSDAGEPTGGSPFPSINLPFIGSQQAPASSAERTTGGEEQTGEGQTSESKPFYALLASYWWVALIVIAIMFLVFKLQLGGKEEHMTPEDLAVLAAPRRVDLMKSLSERKKTLTELSKEESISLPTAKEHLDKLEKSGLVKKLDTGHKWKYYELTRKGERVLKSTDIKNN